MTSARDESSGTKADRTRQRILAAAAGEMARHGYGGTSLRRVADAAGLHQGSLYFHFESKDEMIAAAMREGVEFAEGELAAALASLPASASPETRLRTAAHAHLDALHADVDRGAAVVLMAATLPPELRVRHAVDERRYTRLWLGILRDAQTAGLIDHQAPLRILRDLLVGALNSTLHTAGPSRAVRDKVADAAVDLVLGRYGAGPTTTV